MSCYPERNSFQGKERFPKEEKFWDLINRKLKKKKKTMSLKRKTVGSKARRIFQVEGRKTKNY